MEDYHNQMMKEIRAAIKKGTLSFCEAHRKLVDAVAMELNKTREPADLGVIKACQALLKELHGSEVEVNDEMMQNSLESARKKLRKRIGR